MHGENANKIFPIEIKRSANVHELRRAIKLERLGCFQYRDEAVHLMLWAVSLPITHNIEETIVETSLLEDEKLLPVALLSDIFPDQPPRDHIHVVIKKRKLGHVVKRFMIESLNRDRL